MNSKKIKCKLDESSGLYSLTDYMMSHFTSGKISAHVYAFMKNDTQIFVGSVKFGPEKDDSASEYNGVINSDKAVVFSGKQAKITVGENKLFTQTDTKVPISPDEICNNFKYKESFYGLKNNLDYYRRVRTALAAGSGKLYKSIYPLGVLLNHNTQQNTNIVGEYSVDIKLPKAYKNKEIVIYELEEDGVGLSLGNCYKMMTNNSDYVNINTKWTGDFVIAAEGEDAMMGDLNFDGNVDLSDVLMLLKAALGINELTEAQFNISDMDSDNNIGLNDVMILLKASLGITG